MKPNAKRERKKGNGAKILTRDTLHRTRRRNRREEGEAGSVF